MYIFLIALYMCVFLDCVCLFLDCSIPVCFFFLLYVYIFFDKNTRCIYFLIYLYYLVCVFPNCVCFCVCFLVVFLCVFLDGVIVCVLQKKETRAV